MIQEQIKEFLLCVLPERGDKGLKNSLLEIAYIHSKGTGLIGINSHARKFYGQKPFEVKKRTIYVDELEDESYLTEIKKMIKNCLDPFTLLIRNKDADLLEALFIPEGYPSNPYIRFLEL